MSRVLRLSEADYSALLKRQPKTRTQPQDAPKASKSVPRPISKYRNQRTEVGGIKFASKREARRYQELKTLEDAGEIHGPIGLQVRFPLFVEGIKICTYVADFVYVRDHFEVVEDVKGYRTPMYKLKKKLMFAIHGIKITET
jgi:hypothetical protein